MAANPLSSSSGAAATEPLLDIRNLDVYFRGSQGRFQAVKGLDLSIQRGETVALVGESGCGKSTTALAIMQLLAPGATLSGEIRFGELNLAALKQRQMNNIRGSEISMIFQEPMTSLNPVHTIGAQISEVLRRHEGLSRQAARARSLELLELVSIPEPQRRLDDYPHNLSGGQRQRVMIAMAVACTPRLLIADEPTTALDVTIQAQVLELLDRLRRELSMGMLLITHDLGVVSQWADRVAVMYDGEKVEEGDTRSLFDAPSHPYTQGLMGASLHGGNSGHYSESRLPEIRTRTDAQTGEHRFELYTPPLSKPPAAGSSANRGAANPAPLLQVENLVCAYSTPRGPFVAVDNAGFQIAPGESLGLVGESGSGKSTLSKAVMRLLPVSAGRIVFDGKDITQLKEKALMPWRPRVQMIFQDPYASLNPRRSVYDILDTVLRVHGVKDRSERASRIAAILDRVGLPSNAGKRYPNEFSGGQRQRIGIARALILKPDLVVCDEPVSALDVSVQAQILNLLVELKEEFGLSYLFISHDLAVVRYIADRVMVMNKGQIVESGDYREIWQSPTHPYTRSLLKAIPGYREQAA